MIRPLISIVTINFNNFDGLMETLNSLIENSDRQVELIIIDGESTDGSRNLVLDTLPLLKTLFNNVYYNSEPDCGIYDAMNKGLNQCRGDYVGFLNSGDKYASSIILQTIISVIKRTTYPDGVYGDLKFVDADNNITRYWSSGKFGKLKFLYGWMPPHPTTYLKRSKLDQTGRFDTVFQIAADYDLLLRFCYLKNHKLTKIDACLVCMETGGVSNKSLLNILYSNIEVCRSWKKNIGWVPFWILLLKPLGKLLQKM